MTRLSTESKYSNNCIVINVIFIRPESREESWTEEDARGSGKRAHSPGTGHSIWPRRASEPLPLGWWASCSGLVHLAKIGLNAAQIGGVVGIGLASAAAAGGVASLWGARLGRHRMLVILALLGSLG